MTIRRALAVVGLTLFLFSSLFLTAQTTDLQSATQAVTQGKMPARLFDAMPVPTPPKPAPAPASIGPDRNRHWEIEVHGGGAFFTNPTDGQKFTTPAAASFVGPVGPTKAVSSYMFGDGAALFNTVINNGGFVGTTLITPLDPVMNSSFAERQAGGGLGARLGYDFNKRFGVEFNFDYSFAPMSITGASLAGVEATRSSWAAAHTDNFTNGCGCTNTVTAASSFVNDRGSQTALTGALNVNLMTGHRWVPYVTFGGGTLISNGDPVSATILGQYTATIGSQYDGTDLVMVQARPSNVVGVGLVGVGVKYYVSDHWGFRLDFRDLIGGNGQLTLLSATPSHTSIPGSGPVGPGGNPTLQFSNDATLGQDTLSGPALSRFRTFSGTGAENHMTVSAGLFWRF